MLECGGRCELVNESMMLIVEWSYLYTSSVEIAWNQIVKADVEEWPNLELYLIANGIQWLFSRLICMASSCSKVRWSTQGEQWNRWPILGASKDNLHKIRALWEGRRWRLWMTSEKSAVLLTDRIIHIIIIMKNAIIIIVWSVISAGFILCGGNVLERQTALTD